MDHGGSYGRKVVYLIEGLTRLYMYDIGLAKINSRHLIMPTTIQCQQTIGIDYNTIIYLMGRFKADPVAAVANIRIKWAQHGFVIVPVVDRSISGDKSGGDDGTGKLTYDGGHQDINDKGWVAVARERG